MPFGLFKTNLCPFYWRSKNLEKWFDHTLSSSLKKLIPVSPTVMQFLNRYALCCDISLNFGVVRKCTILGHYSTLLPRHRIFYKISNANWGELKTTIISYPPTYYAATASVRAYFGNHPCLCSNLATKKRQLDLRFCSLLRIWAAFYKPNLCWNSRPSLEFLAFILSSFEATSRDARHSWSWRLRDLLWSIWFSARISRAACFFWRRILRSFFFCPSTRSLIFRSESFRRVLRTVIGVPVCHSPRFSEWAAVDAVDSSSEKVTVPW